MYPSTLQVVVGDSRWRLLYLGLAHLIGGVALLLATVPAEVQWSGIAALGFSQYFYARPRPPFRMRCHQDGSLKVSGNTESDDIWQKVEIDGSSCISTGCVLLRFTEARERRCKNLLILSDSMPATDFRRLRIWLGWRAVTNAGYRINIGN